MAHWQSRCREPEDGRREGLANSPAALPLAILPRSPPHAQLMSPVVEAGAHVGRPNGLYGALLRVVRRCMELAAWTEVANSDVVLCVPVRWAKGGERRGEDCFRCLSVRLWIGVCSFIPYPHRTTRRRP